MLMNNLFQVPAVRDHADTIEQMDPKKCNCLVIFFRMAATGRELAQGVAHMARCVARRRRFQQINPGDMQVRRVMQILIGNLTSLQCTGKFNIIHALFSSPMPR